MLLTLESIRIASTFQSTFMPRKRRTANPDKTLKVWVAPEWHTRLHENHSSAVLSSSLSRYVSLADKVLAKEARDNAARSEAEGRREKSDGVAHHPILGSLGGHTLSPEALIAQAAPRMMLSRPPKGPVYAKPRKLAIPKPPATPVLSKPRRVNYPKLPSLPR